MVIFKIVNSPTALQIDRSSLGPKTAPGLVEPADEHCFRFSLGCPSSHTLRHQNTKEQNEGKMTDNYHSTKKTKHTTAGIRWSSPTQLLIRPLPAYLWESGRDPEFSVKFLCFCLC
ncbi:hypothetical protein FG05_35305 [Fusarium graminearum]|nr:hypothetical protein FG05_35305 [Fusarium graminearum]